MATTTTEDFDIYDEDRYDVLSTPSEGPTT
jgi:hypothetical protein